MEFIWSWLAVPQLLRNLFAVWKRDLTSYGQGFDPKVWAQAFAFNTVGRLVGFVARALFILLALILEILLFIFGLAIFLVWLTFILSLPALLAGGIYLALAGNEFGFLFLLLAIILAASGLFAYKQATGKPYNEMSLDELMKQGWFSRVWQHLGWEQPPSGLPELRAKLRQLNLNENEFALILRWEIFSQQQQERAGQWWRRDVLLAKPPLTRNWAYGYTYHLNNYVLDLTRLYVLNDHRIVAHNEEMRKMEEILSKFSQANVLLVGDPGSGKTSVVYAFAKYIARGKASSKLAFKRVLEFKIDEALAGLPNASAMQEKISELFFEAAMAGNVILVIEDIDRYVTQQAGVGRVDLSAVLNSFLPYPSIQIVGTTSHQAFHKVIEPNALLMKHFEQVELKEPTYDDLFFILNDVSYQLEKETGVMVAYTAVKEIARLSLRYFQDIPLPQRAINILRDVIGKAQKANIALAGVDLVDAAISEKTGVNTGTLNQDEKNKLLRLEEVLHQRVISQDEAIKEIASAMRRRRLEIGDTMRPIGSFLFLGPTGVGKTETAKALALAYFGDEKRMVRLDMTEYKEMDSLERLIGNADGQIVGQLAAAIREHPFCVLLLDEIEKASKEVIEIFMQVLEDGFLTDGLGRKVSFREAIIIATSNAGADLIRNLVEQGKASLVNEKSQVLDAIQQQGIFKPEFINRFDAAILFEPLSKENLMKIASLMLQELAKRLEQQQLQFQFGDDLTAKVAELGYEPQYGARPMRRVIQDKIEDLIAKKILTGEIQKNQPFAIKGEEI